jgi:hypothetical protein
MDRRWILTLVQWAVCSAPGSKACTNRLPMPASVSLTAPHLSSICSPNTTAAGEDGIHRRGWHPRAATRAVARCVSEHLGCLEAGIHRHGRHPERQPSRLPVASPNTSVAWRMEFIETEGTREGCRWRAGSMKGHPRGVPVINSPAPPAHRPGAFCSVCGHRPQRGCRYAAG